MEGGGTPAACCVASHDIPEGVDRSASVAGKETEGAAAVSARHMPSRTTSLKSSPTPRALSFPFFFFFCDNAYFPISATCLSTCICSSGPATRSVIGQPRLGRGIRVLASQSQCRCETTNEASTRLFVIGEQLSVCHSLGYFVLICLCLRLGLGTSGQGIVWSEK